jgi:hypothetical protein
LKEAIAAGKQVRFEGQSIMGNTPDYSTFTGKIIDGCGPHFPEAHRFYFNAILENGKVIKVI